MASFIRDTGVPKQSPKSFRTLTSIETAYAEIRRTNRGVVWYGNVDTVARRCKHPRVDRAQRIPVNNALLSILAVDVQIGVAAECGSRICVSRDLLCIVDGILEECEACFGDFHRNRRVGCESFFAVRYESGARGQTACECLFGAGEADVAGDD